MGHRFLHRRSDGLHSSQAVCERRADRGRTEWLAVAWWKGITSIMQNIGGFFGIWAFSRGTHLIGRKPAFAIAFIAAGLSTAFVFWKLNDFNQIYWMVPLMGFSSIVALRRLCHLFPGAFSDKTSQHRNFVLLQRRTVRGGGGPLLALGMLTSQILQRLSGADEARRRQHVHNLFAGPHRHSLCTGNAASRCRSRLAVRWAAPSKLAVCSRGGNSIDDGVQLSARHGLDRLVADNDASQGFGNLAARQVFSAIDGIDERVDDQVTLGPVVHPADRFATESLPDPRTSSPRCPTPARGHCRVRAVRRRLETLPTRWLGWREPIRCRGRACPSFRR